MTAALTVYSAVFARYALAVSPQNYLLFGCHVINCSAQAVQGYRFLNYWKYVSYYILLLPICRSHCCSWGGREKSLADKAKAGADELKQTTVAAVESGVQKAKELTK